MLPVVWCEAPLSAIHSQYHSGETKQQDSSFGTKSILPDSNSDALEECAMHTCSDVNERGEPAGGSWKRAKAEVFVAAIVVEVAVFDADVADVAVVDAVEVVVGVVTD